MKSCEDYYKYVLIFLSVIVTILLLTVYFAYVEVKKVNEKAKEAQEDVKQFIKIDLPQIIKLFTGK